MGTDLSPIGAAGCGGSMARSERTLNADRSETSFDASFDTSPPLTKCLGVKYSAASPTLISRHSNDFPCTMAAALHHQARLPLITPGFGERIFATISGSHGVSGARAQVHMFDP